MAICDGTGTGGGTDYDTYLKAAFLSARRNAPSLLPHLIVDGPPNDVSAWFEAHGKAW